MKIAIIDLHPITRSGLRAFVLENFTNPEILQAANIRDFFSQYTWEKPDLIIMTIGQLEYSSEQIEFIKMAIQKYPAAKLIVHDEKPDFSTIGKYLSLRIHGYIAKQSQLSELLECIQDVLAGKKYICNLVFDKTMESRIEADTAFSDLILRKDAVSLSPRQREIASYLIEGKKTSEIARILNRSTSTISTTKANIMGKYKVDNILKLRTAIQLQR